MNEREMLEFAAKAAGRGYGEWTKRGIVFADVDAVWNPLTDDGDRWRLAAACKLTVDFEARTVDFELPNGWYEHFFESDERSLEWCVVRAAAEIGKAMP